jgi:hypothetical protein
LATAEAKGGKGFRAYIVGRNIKAAEEENSNQWLALN